MKSLLLYLRQLTTSNSLPFLLIWILFCVVAAGALFLTSDSSSSRGTNSIRHTSSDTERHTSTIKRRKKGVVVSVALNDVLYSLKENSNLHVHTDNVETLKSLVKGSSVVAIAKVASDDEQASVVELMERLGIFESGLARHRLVFCSTEFGRSCIVRQLNPTLHMESSKDVIGLLDGKGINVSLISTSAEEGILFKDAIVVLAALQAA